MLIYTCDPCKNNNHGACFGENPAPPGVFGGSKCICNICKENQARHLEENMCEPCSRGTHDFCTQDITCLCKVCADYAKAVEVVTEKKVCKCDWCVNVLPEFRDLLTRLNDKDKVFVESLLEKLMYAETDVGYYQSQVEGTWPGWEWIKEEKEKRGL